MAEERYAWRPATAAQKSALDSQADILFFGGSAGSLKTETLLMDAVQEYKNPNLRAIIFRKSFGEMTDLVDKTARLYQPLGGEWVGSPKWLWRFKSGATIRFAYIKTDLDWKKYLGPRYSFIGWDESTLHTEKQIRNLIGRLGSTDRNLRLRVRLCSNPGSIGASWHQQLFLQGQCPVHNPDKCARPGVLYFDRTWSNGDALAMYDPKTKKLIKKFSVCFIPGKLSDHNLLGPEYAASLSMMHGDESTAMLDGCWCKLEGSYFPFLTKGMIRPLAEIDVQWWWNHWISIDYGLGKSSAAAGLYVRSPPDLPIKIAGVRSEESERFPQGRVRKIGEIEVPNAPVHDFARMVVDKFILPGEGEDLRRIVAVYADPSNFNADYDLRHGTGGKSISDQIDEIISPYGLSCQRASNQRVAGWQLVYRMLRSGEFEITDVCRKTFEALRTRIHSEDTAGDIQKVRGDPMDDICLVGDTLVETEGGEVPIKDVKAGDMVWTRKGLRRVLHSGMTIDRAAILTLHLSNGEAISGTAKHRIFVLGKGFLPIDETRYGDTLFSCRKSLEASMSSCIAELSSADTLNQNRGTTDLTILQDQVTAWLELAISTWKSIKTISDRFLKALWFTIATRIRSTMIPQTMNWFQDRRIPSITRESAWSIPVSLISRAGTWIGSDRLPRHGTAQRKVGSGTEIKPRSSTLTENQVITCATIAQKSSNRSTWGITDFALTHASLHGDALPASTISNQSARYAERHSEAVGSSSSQHVPVYVVRISDGGIDAVYNLSVEGEEEFFANGVLVHNCDETRYALYSWIQPADVPRELQLKEAVRGLDITSAAVRWKQKEEELDRDEAPPRFGSMRMRWRQ